ncbi:MAG: HAD-IA family hydrolase, partial [Pseudanabaenaceae cyanobacterium]
APPMAFPGCDPALLADREYEWWYQLAIQTFEEAGYYGEFRDFAAFFRRLYAFFGGPDPWVVYPETREVLTELQRRGYRLAMISNFDSRLFPVLQALQLSSFWEQVIISSQAGAAKPDRQIFQVALDRLGIGGEQALHVGDSEREDYAGAVAAGLRGFWLQRPQQSLRDVLPFLAEERSSYFFW